MPQPILFQLQRASGSGIAPLTAALHPQPSPTLATITWNPADKYANVTLSNSNKTATGLNGVGAAQCCRATTAQTSGKWYYEVRVDTLVANLAIGFDNGTTGVSAFTNPGQSDSKGIVYVGTVVFFGSNGAGPPTVAAAAAGDVVGVAVDAGAGQVWFAKNNVWTTGDPALGTGGYASGNSTFYPFIGPYQADAGTGRWAAADQTYSAPTGFTAWATTAASADVTLALTGQTVTASQGTLSPAVSFALAGQSATVGQGSITAAPSVGITGQSIAVGRGSVTAGLSAALAGQAVAISPGSLLATTSVALLGAGITVTKGNVSVTGDVTIALTGQAISASAGSLSPSSSLTLTGNGITGSQGTIAPGTSAALVGNVILARAGTLRGTVYIAPLTAPILAGWHQHQPADGSWAPNDNSGGTAWRSTTKGRSTW